MNQFHDTPITDRATGRTFMHQSYCESPAKAEALARLTFTNPAVFAVGEEVVQAAQDYSEGWNPGWTLANLDALDAQQTELF